MENRGEIIREAVYKSGWKVEFLAKKLGVVRGTVYNYYKRINVSLDTVIAIGKIIHHDFSDKIPALKIYRSVDDVSMAEEGNDERKYSDAYWRKKYYELLELHNEALREISILKNNK